MTVCSRKEQNFNVHREGEVQAILAWPQHYINTRRGDSIALSLR